MKRYEVCLNILAAAWIDVEADDEAEAEQTARAQFHMSDVQWHEISDVEIKQYTADGDSS